MMKLDSEEVQRITREMNRYLDGITIEELLILRHKKFYFEMSLNDTQKKMDIMTLDLSVRAYNCLKRAGYNTIGQIIDHCPDSGEESSKKKLLKLRNLGKGTADEILIKLFFYQFGVLADTGKKKYIHRVLEINSIE